MAQLGLSLAVWNGAGDGDAVGFSCRAGVHGVGGAVGNTVVLTLPASWDARQDVLAAVVAVLVEVWAPELVMRFAADDSRQVWPALAPV